MLYISISSPRAGGGSGGGGVTSLDSLTGALTLVAGTGVSIVDGVSTITIASTSAGDVTLTPVGSSPNANGASLSGQALTLQPANTSFPGILLAADWNTFNNKQPAGSYITSLTGDGSASGPGAAALTLSTVNTNIGSFTNATLTVNAKGLITAASSGATPLSPTLTDTHIFVGNASNIATDVAVSGDATIANTGALTLNTVNSNIGSFGTASSVSTLTVNAKGLITAAANTAIQIAESQVTNLVSDLAGKQSTALTNAHIFVGNGSNVATDVAVSGDLTLANTGAFTIANLAVTNAKIANSTIDLTAKVTGLLPVANGGTGIGALTAHNLIAGNGTSAVNFIAPGASGNVLQSNGTDWTSVASTSVVPVDPSLLSNISTKYSVASNIATITVTQADGATVPAGGSPAAYFTRGTTATVGSYAQVSITGTSTIILTAGTELGLVIGGYIYTYGASNGTILAASAVYDENSLQSYVAESAAVTCTSASPCVVTENAHGRANGDIVQLTAGAFPTGLAGVTNYYIVNQATNTYQLAATFGGTAINSSSTGTSVVVHVNDNKLVASAGTAAASNVGVKIISRTNTPYTVSVGWGTATEVSAITSPPKTTYSQVYVGGIPALGSAGSNKIYTYPTTQIINGLDLTYTRNTTNGDFITVNTPGIYSIECVGGGGTNNVGISINATTLSQSINGLTFAQGNRGSYSTGAAGISRNLPLALGDIIRVHTDAGGTIGGNGTDSLFHVLRIG